MTLEQFNVNSYVKRAPDGMSWLVCWETLRVGNWNGNNGTVNSERWTAHKHAHCLQTGWFIRRMFQRQQRHSNKKEIQHGGYTLQGKVWSSPLKWKNNHERAVMEWRPFHGGVRRKRIIPPTKYKRFPRRGTLYAQLDNKLLSTMQNHPVWFIPKQCGDKH